MAKKKSSKKEKEVFKIEKEGKEKIVEKEVKEIQTETKPKQAEKENKILRNILIALGIIIIFVLTWIYMGNYTEDFEYENIKFDIIKEKSVTFYHTSFPINTGKKTIDYNIYIRNDPRELDKINFNGDLLLSKMTVIQGGNDFNCEGDGVIAIANMQQILKDGFGVTVLNDPQAQCDPQAIYTLIKIVEGDETKIDEIGRSCYEIKVNDCEIIKGTERFVWEILKRR